MFYLRVITAVIGGSIFLYFLYLGGSWTSALVMLLSGLGLFEATEIIFERKKLLSVFSGILGSLICLLHTLNSYISLTLIIILLLMIMVFSDLRYRWMIIWIAYFPLAISKLKEFRSLNDGFLILLCLLALVWAGDSAAYFAGLSIGKKKLWQNVSPGKTWEGTISGIITGALTFAIISSFLFSKNIFSMFASGLLLSIAAIIGDLFESHFKRTFSVKDSGKLLPGHGGILDRFDSLAFALLSFSLLIRFTW